MKERNVMLGLANMIVLWDFFKKKKKSKRKSPQRKGMQSMGESKIGHILQGCFGLIG